MSYNDTPAQERLSELTILKFESESEATEYIYFEAVIEQFKQKGNRGLTLWIKYLIRLSNSPF